MTTPNETADLAHTILADSEDEHPVAMYVLNVREARTLANAALAADRVEAIVGRLLDADADPMVSRGGVFISRTSAAKVIHAALNGDTNA